MFMFYKHRGTADGYLGKCKECCKREAIQNRKDHIDYYREYDIKRGSRITAGDVANYRKKYPNVHRAHQLIRNAKRRGVLKNMMCEQCGSDKSVAHHDDYSKPLEIRWLCQMHHLDWHKNNGDGKNKI
jgi:ribosomal protein S27AE